MSARMRTNSISKLAKTSYGADNHRKATVHTAADSIKEDPKVLEIGGSNHVIDDMDGNDIVNDDIDEIKVDIEFAKETKGIGCDFEPV